MTATHVMASTLLRSTAFKTKVLIKHEYMGFTYYDGEVGKIFNDEAWESEYSTLRVENISITNGKLIVGVIRL